MGGYIKKSVEEHLHSEDRCPSYDAEFANYTCAGYSDGLYTCPGHRNKDISRPGNFADYDKGSLIQNSNDSLQHTALSGMLQTEIDERQRHTWYSNLADFSCTKVNTGDIIAHNQENVINDAIDNLNNLISQKQDWGISDKDDTTPHKVNTGYITEAENLKYLERNVLASYRDCVCYSDCTSHGISSYSKRTWCSAWGEEDKKKKFYF